MTNLVEIPPKIGETFLYPLMAGCNFSWPKFLLVSYQKIAKIIILGFVSDSMYSANINYICILKSAPPSSSLAPPLPSSMTCMAQGSAQGGGDMQGVKLSTLVSRTMVHGCSDGGGVLIHRRPMSIQNCLFEQRWYSLLARRV